MKGNNIAIIILAFIAGMSSLIYEVSWIRPLQYLLGSTTYSISIIFSCFMLGLALGSLIFSKFLYRLKKNAEVFIFSQIILAVYCVLMPSIFNLLPSIYSLSLPLYNYFWVFNALIFFSVFLSIALPCIIMGTVWPILVEMHQEKSISLKTGIIYASYNAGGIVGALVTGMILIPLIGVKWTIFCAASLTLASSFIVILLSAKKLGALIPLGIFTLLIISSFSSFDIKTLYEQGIYRKALSENPIYSSEMLFHADGRYATVDVIEEAGVVRSLLINGKGQGGTSMTDKRVNYLLAYLGILLGDNPSNALLIGLGTGTTAGHLGKHVKTEVIEIEPKITETVGYFSEVNRDVLNNKNVNIVYDDGRSYLANSKEKFDIIIPEPSDPWQDFSSLLFSEEFFQLSAQHLTNEGLFIQWIPIYELSAEDFRNFYKTFNSVFPNVIIFANVRAEERSGPYPTELILVGSKSGINIVNAKKNFYLLDEESRKMLEDVMLHRTIQKRFEGEDAADRIAYLALFNSEQLVDYANNSRIITDDNLLLEFSAARNIYRNNREEVMSDLRGFVNENKTN
ncbi:MAG: fused MFS/spermidine synthase [archaeon]